MSITCKTELVLKSILNISQNIANIASGNTLITSTFHHTVECLKTVRFTETYYIETSHYHRHF